MQSAIHSKRQLLIEPKKRQLLIEPQSAGPCVSIMMAFEPKMQEKSRLQQRLKGAVQMAEEQLLAQYPPFKADHLIKKIWSLIDSLDYTTYRKSIVLFISPAIEKVYYLDIEMDEKIIVKQTFEIRDIINNKPREEKYLLLFLSNENEKLFLGNREQLKPLVLNHNYFADSLLKLPARQAEDEMLTEKFFRRIDNGLSRILKAYPYPLFLVCTKKAMKLFKKVSKNIDHVIEYLIVDFEDAGETEFKSLMNPYIKNWEKTAEEDLLLRLQRSISKGKCAVGIKDVFKKARQLSGNLLAVESNYRCPALIAQPSPMNTSENPLFNNCIYIKDTVDDVIEKVLQNGGDVKFVSEGLLDDYMHIALI
jgi:hypothetical protein